MIGTINRAEHNLFADPAAPIVLAAGVAGELLPNEKGVATGEIAYRYIQNVGVNEMYYAFAVGTDENPSAAVCNADVYHGKLPAGSQLDCSNHRLRVCGYSASGTTVSTTIIRRNP